MGLDTMLLCPPKNYFGVFLSFIICNSFCFSLYFDWYRIFCPIISYKNLFDCDPFCVISGRFSCFNPPCDRNLVHFICIYHNPWINPFTGSSCRELYFHIWVFCLYLHIHLIIFYPNNLAQICSIVKGLHFLSSLYLRFTTIFFIFMLFSILFVS